MIKDGRPLRQSGPSGTGVARIPDVDEKRDAGERTGREGEYAEDETDPQPGAASKQYEDAPNT